MKNLLLLTIILLGTQVVIGQNNRLLFEATISAAYSTTDVRSKTDVGLGYSVGYSFNYDYGHVLGFDVKFRYHEACWHGQDFKTTSLVDYGNDYSGPLLQYKNELGYTVNNFQNDAKEYGLEFSTHFNRLRENTRFDPYFSVGVSLLKNRALGDVIRYAALPKIYRYDDYVGPMDEIENILDGNFETPLVGSEFGTRVQAMPTVGIGLAFLLSDKFSIAVEHKTLITCRDDFDGFVPLGDRSAKSNKDLVHYTGLTIRFHPALNFKR